MANNWTIEPEPVITFDNTALSQQAIFTNLDGEWSCQIKKSGIDKGTIKLDSLADFKDFFAQVGPSL